MNRFDLDKALDKIYDSSDSRQKISDSQNDYQLITQTELLETLNAMHEESLRTSKKTMAISILTLVVAIMSLVVTLAAALC